MTTDPIRNLRTLIRDRIDAARHHDLFALGDIAYGLRQIRESNPAMSSGRVATLQDLERRVKAAAANPGDALVVGDCLAAITTWLNNELMAALSDVGGTQPKRKESHMHRRRHREDEDEDEVMRTDEDEAGPPMMTCEACGHKQSMASESEDESEDEDEDEDEDETESMKSALPGFAPADYGTKRKRRKESKASRIFSQLIDPFAQPDRTKHLVERHGLTARQIFARTLHS